jgi:hypothetical protein
MSDMNYYDMFIEVAEDCHVHTAEAPEVKGASKTIAAIQYEMIARNPYRYTQEDVLFEVFASRNDIPEEERPAAREKFFSKAQPCLRSSPLGKRYGWGVHNDAQSRVAVYAVESDEYKKLASDKNLKHLKAMRSKRA